ncbi:MAG: hypothetical protein PHS04_12440 [Tissierellia bacterium]|nr:hypothetical protein [Tissierellia bacterium]
MSKVELNAREIMYLSALAGATELIGIPDGFYGMDELEIKQEILKIQSQLESKEYARADFDGNFFPNTEVMQVIQVCALCEKYLSVDKISATSANKLLFYLYDNRVIKVKAISDKFELTTLNPVDINPYILKYINWITQEEKDVGNKVVIPPSLLKQIKGSTEDEFASKTAMEELYKTGCNNIQAQIIYSGLSGTSNYYSVIMVDFNSEENDVMSIMVINSKSGSLEVLPVDTGGKEAVAFHSIDYDTFKNKLIHALTLMGITDDGGDFK